MRRRKKPSSLMTYLKWAGLLIAGAVFSPKIIELVSKAPVIGDSIVKAANDQQNASTTNV